MPILSAETLAEFTASLFESVGVPADDARVVALSLVGANLRGHDSHGVMRAVQYIGFLEQGQYRTGIPLKVERDDGATLVADGGWNLGQVQAHRLLDLMIPRALDRFLVAAAGRDFGHTGRLGEYAERCAAQGLIFVATVNNCGAGQRVAPPGGIAPRLGTNPLCVGVPTEGEPIVLDFGTSVAAEGKVRVYHINKKPTPDGWLLDSHGKPTNDPSVLYEQPLGSILPMGGLQAYKGFGLALVLDILASGLSGGRTSFPGAPPAKGNNLFFLVVNPSGFAGSDALIREATHLAAYLRETPRAEGVERILLPGDPERAVLERRSREGIPIEPMHWERLTETATRLGIMAPAVETD